jgi:hypothetical protein
MKGLIKIQLPIVKIILDGDNLKEAYKGGEVVYCSGESEG